jgi:hypothetical protein
MLDLTDFIDIEMPEVWDDGRPGFMRFLDKLKEWYEETDNPLFAWGAYRYARELIKKNYDLAIPEWVLAYLDESADRLWEIESGLDESADESRKDSRKNSAGTKIAIALKMYASGQGDIFLRHDRALGRLLITELVDMAKTSDPSRSLEEIFEDIADKQLTLIEAISPKQKEDKYNADGDLVKTKYDTAKDLVKKWYEARDLIRD